MKKFFLVIVLSISLFGKTYYNQSSDAREIGWMDKSKEEVKLLLKDGDSAKFRDIYFNKGKLNLPASCGEVNAKNSFGAYIGYTKFIFIGTGKTFLESDIKDFYNLWNQLCE